MNKRAGAIKIDPWQHIAIRIIEYIITSAKCAALLAPLIYSTDAASKEVVMSTFWDDPGSRADSFVISEINVVIVPRDWLFRVRLNEERMKAVGCLFSTTDDEKKRRFFGIFDGVTAEVDRRLSEDVEFEPRIYVQVIAGGGTATELLLTWDADYGYLRSPDAKDYVRIVTNISLVNDISRWAVGVSAPNVREPGRQWSCDAFVKHVMGE